MTDAQLRYSSIDDYLGPAEARFFGQGYRRAEYQVGDIVARPVRDARPGIHATVTVGYPRDWSRKSANVDLRPHLSTVDMLVLGVQFSEMHLTHAYGLDAVMRQTAWLRRVTLRAGSKPQEDLVGLPGTAILRATKAAPDTPNSFISVYDCQVGEMQARCEIEHQVAERATDERSYASIQDILGPAASRYYGEGFKLRQQHIEDVRADMTALRSSATVQIASAEESHTAAAGIEGKYQPSLSMIDCFVTNLQLAQLLMYEMDSVERHNSNTLWMLRTVLDARQPHRPCTAPLEAHTSISGKHLLPLRGGRWRNVDIGGHCGDVSLRASFAHELPTDIARNGRLTPGSPATNNGSQTT
jgi:hypothetical protein